MRDNIDVQRNPFKRHARENVSFRFFFPSFVLSARAFFRRKKNDLIIQITSKAKRSTAQQSQATPNVRTATFN